MKKRTFTQVLSFVLVVIMMIGAFPVFGASAELTGITKDGFEYVIEDEEVTITRYASDNPIVNIPSTIDGFPVTTIGRRAFSNVISDPKHITEVTIPDSVKIIENSAFSGCYIKSITIPESVVSIGSEAFYWCQSLEEVSLPKRLEYINSNTFLYSKYESNKDNWTDGVLYIDSVLIKADESIKGDHNIKKGTTIIAENAFYGCSSLKNVTIPEGVVIISKKAFYECTALESITIPDTVIDIGEAAFYRCLSLKSDIKIPESVTTINDETFYGCESIESITIPETVTDIGRSAFSTCYSLKNISLPPNVKTISSF